MRLHIFTFACAVNMSLWKNINWCFYALSATQLNSSSQEFQNHEVTMSKKSSTQESLVLSFEILKRIPKSYKVTAKELLNIGIERDLRTIQRNLEMLCEHFDIIRDERSKPYGYKWKQ